MAAADPKGLRLRAGRAVLLAAAFGAALLPVPPPLVERWYTNGFYAAIQPVVTLISNDTRFAVFDALWIGVLAAFLVLAARDFAAFSILRAIARALVRAATWAAALYLGFAILWGLNYRRERLVDRLPFDANAVTASAALRLASTSVDRLNALHATAHAEGWPIASAIEPSLAGAFDRVTRQVGSPVRVVAGRPKRSLLDWYFRRAGVSGMTDPYFLETLVAGDLLPFERPFVVAHEWGHLAGLADEGEANAVGWLVCLQASPANAYSGWLFMYGEVIRALPEADRAPLVSRLGEGPRADLRAIRDRMAASVSPQMSAVGWRVYDSYLKANRVETGMRSYDEVLRLALGLKLLQVY